MYALTSIRGIGRRFAAAVCKKADVDATRRYLNKQIILLFNRAGDLSNDEIEKLVDVISKPLDYKIPQWFLNRQKDHTTGVYTQLSSNQLSNSLREDIERLKKIRAHRGLRHHWGIRVRGQHTKSNGRRGKTMGVSKKKGG